MWCKQRRCVLLEVFWLFSAAVKLSSSLLQLHEQPRPHLRPRLHPHRAGRAASSIPHHGHPRLLLHHQDHHTKVASVHITDLSNLIPTVFTARLCLLTPVLTQQDHISDWVCTKPLLGSEVSLSGFIHNVCWYCFFLIPEGDLTTA